MQVTNSPVHYITHMQETGMSRTLPRETSPDPQTSTPSRPTPRKSALGPPNPAVDRFFCFFTDSAAGRGFAWVIAGLDNRACVYVGISPTRTSNLI